MMLEEDIETAIKVLVVGNGAVGKSSMIQRYCKGIFTKEYKKTIGVDFLERLVDVDGEDVRLMLWDTAGQEEFDAITKAYYRGAQGCVIVYSTIDRDSYEAVEKWLDKVQDEVGCIPCVLVENKTDLNHFSCIEIGEGEELAERLGFPLFKTSVKNNSNIDNVFRCLAEKYIEEMNCIKNNYNIQHNAQTVYSTQALPSITDVTHKLPNHENKTIKLHPTKRRTQGKKSILPNLRCSLF